MLKITRILLIGILILFTQKLIAKGQSDIARIRFQNAGQIQNYIDQFGQPLGRVCAAETGRVYLRGDNLKSSSRTLLNGTYIKFIGTRDNYAWVQVMKTTEHQVMDNTPIDHTIPSYRIIPTAEYGYITSFYTCGYDY